MLRSLVHAGRREAARSGSLGALAAQNCRRFSTALPVVGVIDMENKDGSVYTSTSAATEIESIELSGTASVVYTGATCIEDVDPALLESFSAVLLRRCPFGAPQLAALPNLKCVLRMGAGYDNVDTAACTAAEVVACNCPDAWVEEVADSALSLLLALTRRTFELSDFVGSGGGWTRQAALPRKGMRRLRGMRLGLVGLGRIGTAVAQRARAFGLDVAFYDPHKPAGVEKGLGGLGRHDSFDALLGASDIISFHCPLTAETSNLLSAAALGGLSADRPLWVVNTARGGVLDEEALLEALADGRVAGAALDSLEAEPKVSPSLLAAQADGANLLITPHAAFYLDEAFEEMRHLAAREVGRVLRGETPLYRVN